MRTYRRKSLTLIFLFACPLVLISCSEPQSEDSFESAIARYMEKNEFEAAFERLDAEVAEADSDQNVENITQLRVQVHLAYANYLTHEADHLGMASRMSDALRHYRRVMQLDPDNSQAQTHIELIEGIYEQMGRDIPEGIAD